MKKQHHKKRRAGLKPAAYKIGDGGYEEAEQRLRDSSSLLKVAQEELGKMLKDAEHLEIDSRFELHARISENARAAAAVFREMRTSHRFGQEGGDDIDPADAMSVVVETFRRLPPDLRQVAVSHMLEASSGPQGPAPEPDHHPPPPLKLVLPGTGDSSAQGRDPPLEGGSEDPLGRLDGD